MREASLEENFIQRIIKPLVRTGVYKNHREALKGIALDYAKREGEKYKRKIKSYEKKYKMRFEEFTDCLRNKATAEDEDEWMEWEYNIVFYKKWQEIESDIRNS